VKAKGGSKAEGSLKTTKPERKSTAKPQRKLIAKPARERKSA
jgi:hypothetical protein